MSETHASQGRRHEAGHYEIRLQGHLEPRWAAWFDGMCLSNESDGTTLIHGTVVDQAALYGLLQRARDVGLPLVSVIQVPPPSDANADTPVARDRQRPVRKATDGD